MKYGPFVAIVATGALVGWIAPDFSEVSSGPSVVTVQEDYGELDVLEQDQWFAGEVVLNREADGHFYADPVVDGVSAHMLVDTGASVVALTAEDADSMGIAWDPATVRPVARGASGVVHGVPVTIERMQLGQLEAERVRAVVVPEGLGVSLLGQTFLSQIERVRVEQDRMVLGG